VAYALLPAVTGPARPGWPQNLGRTKEEVGALSRIRRSLLLIALATTLVVSAPSSAQAFTLVVVTVILSPTSGLPTDPFTARAQFPFDCSTLPPDRYFYFYWDTTTNPQFWSAIRVPCDPKTNRFDTGPSPATTPPKGQNRIGGHKVIVVMRDGSGNPLGQGTHAYTIVWGKVLVSTTPTSGTPTAQFTVHGKFDWPGACPSAPGLSPITFKFSWYKVSSNRIALWSTTVATCSGGIVDTGNSPPMVPPAPLNTPTTYVVHVALYDSGAAPFGQAYGATGYTNTTIYKVVAAPPSPNTNPSPAQCGTPGAAPCATATSTPCQTAAAVHPGTPGGADVAALLTLAALGTLPIGGLAMVFSPGIWRRRSRWNRLAALVGLSVMLLSVDACAALTGQNPQTSPTQAEASPSPSPSPSPTC